MLRIIKADSRFRNIPITMITSQNDLADIARCLTLGAEGFLFKLFEMVLMKARVESCVEKKRLRNLAVKQRMEVAAQKLELKEKNAQLQELNASKDKFFSISAHDLRNPLLAVSGYSHLLQNMLTQQAMGGTLQETADKLGAAIDSLQTLLENLLTWSRLQRGMMSYQPEMVNLFDVIEENIILFKASADQKGIALNYAVPSEIPVYADEIMTKTILRNLISNALKFTPSGGAITVAVSLQPHDIAISVSDTGCGIAPEGLTQLFRLDTQYTQVGTAGKKGTGLGLLLGKDLAEQNHGTLRVES